MKKYFWLAFLFFLFTACTTKYSATEHYQESLKAFLFEDEKLYIVGEQYDYVFENEDITALKAFLLSPYVNDTLFVDIRLEAVNNEVKGEYLVYLDPRKYSVEELTALQRNYWFNPISKIKSSLIPSIQAFNPNWKTEQAALKRQYRARGKLIRLSNRNELLAKYKTRQPLIVPLSRYQISKEFIGVEATGDIALSVIQIPIFTAIAIPILPMLFVYLAAGEIGGSN